MRYYIISGEASGDLHGSNLISALQGLDPQMTVRAWGGDLMEQQGASIVKHYKDLAFMGFVEVLKNLSTILKNIKFCKQDILTFQPDVLILIDYPGFNLRIAKWARQHNIKVVYYISPQIWAWNEGRIREIKQHVDKMLVILPFEKEFYKKHHYPVTYVGHPLLEVVTQSLNRSTTHDYGEKPVIALLPGSRTQEIQTSLPLMLEMTDRFPQYRFVIAQAPGQPESTYRPFLRNKDVLLVKGQTYDLLKQAKAALVTSGTATLETALFGVPQVVCYKGNIVSYWLAKKLIRVKYISLVNLILDKPTLKELIQQDFNPATLTAELDAILHNADYIDKLQTDYTLLWEKLQVNNPASLNAAHAITDFINP